MSKCSLFLALVILVAPLVACAQQEPALNESGGTNARPSTYVWPTSYAFPCVPMASGKLYEVVIDIEDHFGVKTTGQTPRKTPVIRVRGTTKVVIETDSGCFLVSDSSVIKSQCEQRWAEK